VTRKIGIVIGGAYNSGILATGAVEGAVYNYKPAPPAILKRVSRIEAVCRRHNVPLAAAALQFPLHHPAVASVIPGARTPGEVQSNLTLLAIAIPDALWHDLKAEGLLREDAPVPGAQ
jgi:D-threo-aldose 1-dehydrogenase